MQVRVFSRVAGPSRIAKRHSPSRFVRTFPPVPTANGPSVVVVTPISALSVGDSTACHSELRVVPSSDGFEPVAGFDAAAGAEE